MVEMDNNHPASESEVEDVDSIVVESDADKAAPLDVVEDPEDQVEVEEPDLEEAAKAVVQAATEEAVEDTGDELEDAPEAEEAVGEPDLEPEAAVEEEAPEGVPGGAPDGGANEASDAVADAVVDAVIEADEPADEPEIEPEAVIEEEAPDGVADEAPDGVADAVIEVDEPADEPVMESVDEEEAPDEAPDGVIDEAPDEAPDGVVDEAPDEAPDGVADAVADEAPDGVVDEAPDEVPDAVAEAVIEVDEPADEPVMESESVDEEEAVGDQDVEPAGEPDDGRHWYVVHCYSGYENKVRHNLEQRIETMGMKSKIFDVVVPTEEEIEVKDGKRRTVERRVFPGYILVQMILTEESWYVVRNTPGVTGFVGMGNEPTPLRPEEVASIVKRMEAEAPRIKVTYSLGQKVRIIDGPFNDFIGTVDDIDMERAKVRVMVSFFGRDTPVELDFLQVEKA
jgi:transcriptional antiterminator NusG